MAITDITLRKQYEMRAMADDYVDATTRALTARWAQAWNEIALEWREVVTVILARKAAGDPLTPRQLTQLSRTQRALTMTTIRLRELASELGPDLEDAVREVISRTADMTTEVVMTQMPPVSDQILPSFTRVDQEALEQIVERSMGRIVASSMPLPEEALEAVKSSLIRAVPSGWSTQAAAREMLRRVRGGFTGGLTRAMRIARTEMLDAHRAANRAQSMKNSAVDSVIWHAELSSRTCPSCIAMHGTEFPPDAMGPEDHPNGRCTFLPKAKSWRDLGFPEIEEPPDVVQTSADWIDSNPETAIAAMGPDRYRMYTEGTLPLSDMTRRMDNPEWRPSYTATPLNDLRRKAAS